MGIFQKIVKSEKEDVIVVTEATNVFEEIMKAGDNVTLMCANYFYTGKITAVNGETIVLEGAKIVYETGPFNETNFKDAQSLNTNQWFVRIPFIESYGCLNKK